MGRVAESIPSPAHREGQPRGGEASRAKEAENLGVHSLTRLGYSFSTQSPHILTPLPRKVRLCFREDETSRDLREGCRMRPKYSTLEYLVSRTIRSLRPLATVVRAGPGLAGNNGAQGIGLWKCDTGGKNRGPCGGKGKRILD